ncbi:carboxypeptidase regulatory-like domain-containing protein [Candidatus Palauibacter irciniicola]|uniref:carboxypeptidase regulatory-like domain-containing protein n=1 Tax=Candidatus Palauibacter irciniicola TaxID=3056733 RepID=UPI003B01D06D
MTFSCFLAAVLVLPSEALTQRISGTVREADGGRLISGGFVSLLDQSGVAVEADFTAAAGAFSFRAPGPGEYRIRVERIGYAEWVTGPYAVAAGQALAITVEVPRQPVRLGDLRVEVTGVCLDDPRQGEALATVWDEARKALETAVWAEDRGELTFTLTEYERTIDPRSLVTLGSETRTRHDVRPPPFRSLSARQLVTQGYAVVDRDSSVFYAPDANVLLSEEFRDAHCFGLRRDEVEGEARLGVTFRPSGGSNVIGIEGTLWLDEASAALREVELRYRNVPLPRGTDRRRVGANLFFDRVPDGPFYVRDWWIRFPIRGRSLRPILTGLTGDPEPVLAAYRQTGGSVVEAFAGGRWFGTGEGVVAGVLRDSISGEPLPGADIVLRDWGESVALTPRPEAAEAPFSAVTDDAGAFRVTGLPGGVYALGVDHPRLRTAGVRPDERRVVVEDRSSEALELWTPSAETVFTRTCPNLPSYGSRGAVVGVVRDPDTGLPVPGVAVEALWRTWTMRMVGGMVDVTERTDSASDVSGEEGEFALCRVPLGEPAFLRQAGADVGVELELLTRVAWQDVQVDPTLPVESPEETSTPAVQEVAGAPTEEDVITLEPGLVHEIELRSLGETEMGRLLGRVRDARSHRPVTAAAVSVANRREEVQSSGEVRTDRRGHFVLGELPVGEYELSVRHLGYEPLTHGVTVTRSRTTEVDVRLSPDPVELAPLVATVTRLRRLETQGFYERKHWGDLTGLGTFFTAQDIERRNPFRVTDLIADAPGVRVGCQGGRCGVFSRRVSNGFGGAGCELNVYVDGVLVIRSGDGRWRGNPASVNDFILPIEIGGVEVYSGAAALPAEFSGFDSRCGAVVIWTK